MQLNKKTCHGYIVSLGNRQTASIPTAVANRNLIKGQEQLYKLGAGLVDSQGLKTKQGIQVDR